MDVKLCPFCAETIAVAAVKCKHCKEYLNSSSAAQVGSTFQPATIPAREDAASSHATPPLAAMILVVMGILLLVGGGIGLVHFVKADTTVRVPGRNSEYRYSSPERVHNFGLMQDRQSGILVSSLAMLGGLISLVAGISKLSGTPGGWQAWLRILNQEIGKAPSSSGTPEKNTVCAECGTAADSTQLACNGCGAALRNQ